MEISFLTKILETSLTIAILLWVMYSNNKDRDKREEFYIKKEEEYKSFTDTVLQESRAREIKLEETSRAREDQLMATINRLTEKFDMLEEVGEKVEKISSAVNELTKELK